jgi:hypothetical protein
MVLAVFVEGTMQEHRISRQRAEGVPLSRHRNSSSGSTRRLPREKRVKPLQPRRLEVPSGLVSGRCAQCMVCKYRVEDGTVELADPYLQAARQPRREIHVVGDVIEQ